MIYESYFWKNELLKSFQTICKFRYLKRINEGSCVKVEKSIMLSAYIIRKLKDAEKIPIEFIEEIIRVKRFELKEKIIDHSNWHKIDKNYKLDKHTTIEKEWKYFIDQIIHSFTFIFSYDENNIFDGFYINSDRSKNKELYFISIRDFIYLLLKISEGSIVESHSKRDIIKNNKGDIEFGAMKQIKAIYAYPNGFEINKILENSLRGIIYKRINEV